MNYRISFNIKVAVRKKKNEKSLIKRTKKNYKKITYFKGQKEIQNIHTHKINLYTSLDRQKFRWQYGPGYGPKCPSTALDRRRPSGATGGHLGP